MSRLILCTLLMVTPMILTSYTRVSELQFVSTIHGCFLSLTAEQYFCLMKRSIFEMSEFISKLTAFDLLLFFTLNTHTHTPRKDTVRTPFFPYLQERYKPSKRVGFSCRPIPHLRYQRTSRLRLILGRTLRCTSCKTVARRLQSCTISTRYWSLEIIPLDLKNVTVYILTD